MAGVDDILAKYEVAAPAPGRASPAMGGGGIDDVLARYEAPASPDETAAASGGLAAAAPSGASAALRGVKQGLTLGFGDEVQGALAAAFSGFKEGEYARARDAARAEDKAAKEAHPWLYGGGNLLGGAATALIPGLNVAKGATMAVTAGRAALAGAAAGLGESEADLTKGEVGHAALDTAVGAGLGGALGAVGHGIGKAIAGAPARAEAAELAGLKEGVQTSTKIKLFGKAGRNEPAIKMVLRQEPAIRTAIERDPGAALPMVESKLDKVSARLDRIYDQAQVAGQGVPVSDVTAAMKAVEAEYRKTSATKPLADAVKGAIENFEGQWTGKEIPFQDLRAEVGAFAKQGFEGGGMFSVPVGKQLKRDIAGAMRDVLQEHIEKVAPKTGTARKILQSANAEYSTWSGIRDAVEQKATREVAGAPTMGQMLEAVSHSGIKGAVKGAAKGIARAADLNVLAPVVRNVPRIVSSPIAAGFRALQQGTAAAAPNVPGLAAAGLGAALSPSDEEAVATETP